MTDEQQIIDKMQVAFDEFAAHMKELEKRAGGLVKESLKQIDQEKIAAALAEVKKASLT